MDQHIFFRLRRGKGAAQEKGGAASRTMSSVRDEKNGIYDKNASATFHHLFYALVGSTPVCRSRQKCLLAPKTMKYIRSTSTRR